MAMNFSILPRSAAPMDGKRRQNSSGSNRSPSIHASQNSM